MYLHVVLDRYLLPGMHFPLDFVTATVSLLSAGLCLPASQSNRP